MGGFCVILDVRKRMTEIYVYIGKQKHKIGKQKHKLGKAKPSVPWNRLVNGEGGKGVRWWFEFFGER